MKSKSIFCLTIILFISICTHVSSGRKLIIYNGTEDWAYKQIRDNGGVDFNDPINGKNKRVLSGEFISALLTNRLHPIFMSKISNQDNIIIKNAVIKGDIVLNNETIQFPLGFFNCHFESAFYASNTTFENLVVFDNCTFNNIINLRDSTFHGQFRAGKTVFLDYADFTSTKFDSSADFTEAQFNNKNQAISLNSAKVRGDIYFDKATFAGSSDFIGAEFGSLVTMGKVKFTGRSHIAFDKMHISKETLASKVRIDY